MVVITAIIFGFHRAKPSTGTKSKKYRLIWRPLHTNISKEPQPTQTRIRFQQIKTKTPKIQILKRST